MEVKISIKIKDITVELTQDELNELFETLKAIKNESGQICLPYIPYIPTTPPFWNEPYYWTTTTFSGK